MKVRIVWRTAKALHAGASSTQDIEQPPVRDIPSAEPSPNEAPTAGQSINARQISGFRRAERLACPRCESHDVRRSRCSNSLDHFRRSVLGRLPYRCRSCQRRFFVSMTVTGCR